MINVSTNITFKIKTECKFPETARDIVRGESPQKF